MRTLRWSTAPREPQPFELVDAKGRPCGAYANMSDAMRALEFLNEHGNDAPYHVLPLAPAKPWMAA